ncbi:carbon-nitrogen hydrolase [Stutzerimonas stutzeri]|uniref:carbon-nitrogen hydrolase n=1 Tax=Stutzerimonas stutzeri TaxID=316 RepID=UPI0015E3EB05|nr:carbon-nitrogen hydrolase [Stutzerimonas stutzeri]MBA1264746.1 carbon-nitrogen hydrolase [Stutzerimonas stutzeri]
MRLRTKLLILTVLALAALVVYLNWTDDRRSGPLLSDLRTLPISSQGLPGAAGNLLGIETRLLPADYQSRERLHMKFATYLDQARDAGLIGPRTIVVLPEHVGTGLFALGEKPEVQQARTLRDAMQWMALSNPWDYLRALFDNTSEDRRTEAVLRIKAPQMAEDYQRIFAGLAREYGVTLVAGSIVLPEPQLQAGRLKAGTGPLRQVSLVFTPAGEPIGPLHYKTALSRYERRYSQAPESQEVTLLHTPAGRLAVLLGCDGYTRSLPATTELLALPGVDEREANACVPLEPQDTNLPRMAVRTLGLPWNLLGSPRKPAQRTSGEPVQLHNLWLPERP